MPRSVSILVVDDDRVDQMAIQRSLKELKVSNPIHEAQDGLEALEKLRGTSSTKRIPPPWLILLDLNMPRMDGLEFLEVIRSEPELRKAVVFVLTTSARDEDRNQAYSRCIAGYIEKSRFGQDFWRVIEMIDHYSRVVEFP